MPRTAWDGKPDFTGVYYPHVVIAPAAVPLESLYRTETRAARDKLNSDRGPSQLCAPWYPATGAMTNFHPIQLLQALGVFVMIDENANVFRIIANDGDGTVTVVDLQAGVVTGTFKGGTGIENLSYY